MRSFRFCLWLTASFAIAPNAAAFCGFYVSGAGAKLYNNATLVVLMRSGIRTVLSMQNNYQGPPKDFAMVVPVPVVLQKENVKTLPRGVFDRIDKLSAPRLVEYWEQDPCRPRIYPKFGLMKSSARRRGRKVRSNAELGVTVEARFAVGEYQIVILSASDSTGLDTWLRQSGYRIPRGAERYLRPYVQKGTKFFVAKVDVSKVRFERGQAMLSPLRFHYDSEEFSLPVRLGLMNSKGTQDLIVHILAKNQRYEVANYPNVTIPTNIDVAESVKKRFASFYTALFDRTLRRNPGAVVTEYSWDASSCDPCPTPPLGYRDLALLGADLEGRRSILGKGRRRWRRPRWRRGGYTLTRLHARYSKRSLGRDLVFRAAPPIVGGREQRRGGELERGSRRSSINNFQGRYAIRHLWTGPVRCENPRWGQWGGPPGVPAWRWNSRKSARPALKLAFARRGVRLSNVVRQDVPELALRARKQRRRRYSRPAGKWKTTWGTMEIVGGQPFATYSTDDGRIIGRRDGRTLSGHWVERHSARRCASAREGSHYWGRIQFKFNGTFTRFRGRWGYCNSPPSRPWSGKKRGRS